MKEQNAKAIKIAVSLKLRILICFRFVSLIFQHRYFPLCARYVIIADFSSDGKFSFQGQNTKTQTDTYLHFRKAVAQTVHICIIKQKQH